MSSHRVLLLGAALLALQAAPARAHFLFIRIGPPAEAGRAAEVYFSELAEAGDPRFIDKIDHTRLWLQHAPGQFRPLKVHKGSDRLRAALPASGSVVVVGACEYGVLARPKQVPFLLRHYPKAMAGNPEELARMQPCKEVPLEVVATADGDRIHLVALRSGKPVPGAEFHTVDAKLNNDRVTAGADGRATWKPPGPGRYSVYTGRVDKESGEAGGKRYEEVRSFATLAFAWPLEPKGSDPRAVALFQEAVSARASWKDFPGFSAAVAGKVDGRAFAGKVSVSAGGTVQVETKEEVAGAWVQEQLESIVMHRGVSPQDASAAARPAPALRFADQEADHPLGRLLVFEGGKFASSYRVKDRQLTVVNRQTGRQHMTITVLDNERNPEGLFLPHSYTVQYWEAATGALRRTETVQERWRRVGAWDLPATHTVTTASEAGLSVRSFTLTGHQLLAQDAGKKPPAKARPDPAFAAVKDDPALPRVLLIGDSISIGYTVPTQKLLRGKANVHRIPENGGPTTTGLAKLDRWLGEGKWDVIHFNWGLHDLKLDKEGRPQVSLDQYEKNLRELVKRLRATGTRLVWASTTPVPEGNLNPPRKSADVIAYNAAAKKVMEENGVAVDDLYTFALPRLDKIQMRLNVHFTPQGSEALAGQVSASIRSALGK
jgi:lysophospholipase L1-like esterase